MAEDAGVDRFFSASVLLSAIGVAVRACFRRSGKRKVTSFGRLPSPSRRTESEACTRRLPCWPAAVVRAGPTELGVRSIVCEVDKANGSPHLGSSVGNAATPLNPARVAQAAISSTGGSISPGAVRLKTNSASDPRIASRNLVGSRGSTTSFLFHDGAPGRCPTGRCAWDDDQALPTPHTRDCIRQGVGGAAMGLRAAASGTDSGVGRRRAR